MKKMVFLSASILIISSCSTVGTAVDIITLPVDLLTMDSSQNDPTKHALTTK